MRKDEIEQKITEKKRRLDLYKKKEEMILNGEIQSYSMSGRSVTKSNTELTMIAEQISKLEDEISVLAGLLQGKKTRACCRVVPEDI